MVSVKSVRVGPNLEFRFLTCVHLEWQTERHWEDKETQKWHTSVCGYNLHTVWYMHGLLVTQAVSEILFHKFGAYNIQTGDCA